MEKGHERFSDLSYDFDIDILTETNADENHRKFAHDLAILKANFTCRKMVEEKRLLDLTWIPSLDDRLFCIVKARHLAFDEIRTPLIQLANLGDMKALAFYMSLEEPKYRDKDLAAKLQQIEQKPVKTPEEWEVVACSHMHDIVEVENKGLIECRTIEELGLKSLMTYNAYVDLFECKNANAEKTRIDAAGYRDFLMQSEYCKAMQKAQLGYYARYFSGKMYAEDLASYLQSSFGMNINFVPKEVLKGYSAGETFSQRKLEKILRNGYIKQMLKGLDLSDKYALGDLLIDRGSSAGEKKYGLSMMKQISNEPFANPNISNNIRKTKVSSSKDMFRQFSCIELRY